MILCLYLFPLLYCVYSPYKMHLDKNQGQITCMSNFDSIGKSMYAYTTHCTKIQYIFNESFFNICFQQWIWPLKSMDSIKNKYTSMEESDLLLLIGCYFTLPFEAWNNIFTRNTSPFHTKNKCLFILWYISFIHYT